MATVYVTQAGAGAADGTNLANARAMSWLNANVSAGNTYLLEGAITTSVAPGASGSAGSPIIIQAHDNGATLTASGSSSCVNINGRAHVQIIGFTINATGTTGAGVFLQAGANNIVIRGNTITAGSGSCISLAGASASAFTELDILGNTLTGGLTGIRFLGTVNGLSHLGIRIGSYNGARTTISGQTNEGIRLTLETGLTTSTIGGIKIWDTDISDTGYQSITIRAVYASVDDDTPPALWGPGCQIWNVTVSDCGTAGVSSGAIHVFGVQDCYEWNITMRRVYTQGAMLQGQRRKNVAIWNCDLRGATSASGIDGNGIFFDRFDENCAAWDCYIADCPGVSGVSNSGAGLAMWMCTNARFFGIVVKNCSVGLDVGGNAVKTLTACDAHNLTLIDCTTGVQGDNDGTGMDADSIALRNCLFVRCETAIDVRGQELTTCDYMAFKDCDTEYVTQTPGANDIAGDPLVSVDGIPQVGSPLIEAGVFIAFEQAFEGAQRWNPPTIGAYEYRRPRTVR